MEQGSDILKLFSSAKVKPVKYFAEYNILTGELKKVGPEHAFTDVDYKIPIDEDVALSILKGETKFADCTVDIIDQKLIISENKNLIKIDNLLHRIIDIKYAEFDDPHIFLSYNKSKKTMTVEMTEKYHGSKKLPKKYSNEPKKRIHWAGETKMLFLITAYNDPTLIQEVLAISLNDLLEKNVTVKLNNVLADNFSVFTRRIFKNYCIEIK